MAGPYSVLVVDDSGYMRTVIRKYLERNNFIVAAEAENGIEAAELYAKLKPDVITMDISMKQMGGIEATKQICEAHKDATIVMVSALGESRFIREAILAGATDYIVKPFEEERLISSLQTAIDNKKS